MRFSFTFWDLRHKPHDYLNKCEVLKQTKYIDPYRAKVKQQKHK